RAATAKPTPMSNDPRYSGFLVRAYGPEVASASFLRTWPEARARIRRPGTMSSAPAAIDRHDGCASQKYTSAKTNPRGTRIRRAMRDQSVMRFHLLYLGPL